MDAITPEEALRQFHEWKAKQKEAQRRYRETNKDRIAERRKTYYDGHAEEVRERNREYMRELRKRKKEENAGKE
jgi:hypothetical protein